MLVGYVIYVHDVEIYRAIMAIYSFILKEKCLTFTMFWRILSLYPYTVLFLRVRGICKFATFRKFRVSGNLSSLFEVFYAIPR
jgi:hypothetical protein